MSSNLLAILKTGICALVLLLLSALSAAAQDVSLLADDTIDDIVVTVGNQKFAVTVMRDAYNPNQWYYVPTRPRLVETVTGGQRQPVFHLYRYQFDNPANPTELLEGGLLFFTATLGLDPAAIGQLREHILKTKNNIPKASLALSALRMRSAKVRLYSPGANGTFVATPPDGNGDAPIHTTQDMAFAVDLTKIGTSLYKELVEGRAGLKLQVDYAYGGLTPPVGFTVTVDYRQARDYYAQNSTFSAEASYYGLFGASARSDSTSIRETLENNGVLKIDVVQGEGLKKEDIDLYLQPIIKRINDEVLATFAPPAQISAPVANPSGRGGFFGSVNYATATKSVNELKQLSETISLRVRMWQERRTSAAATISVSDYSPEVRKTLFSTVQNLNWESARFRLPSVDLPDDAGVKQVDLTITLKGPRQQLPDRTFTWTSATGWRDAGDKPAAATVFALASEGFVGDELKQAKYETLYTFTYRGRNRSYKVVDDAFSGSRPLTTPTQGIDLLVIDPSRLTFAELEPSTSTGGRKLLKVTVAVSSTQDGPLPTIELQTNRTNNQISPARPVSIPLINPAFAAKASPASLRITFMFNDGTQKVWDASTADLRAAHPDLNITLVDAHWR